MKQTSGPKTKPSPEAALRGSRLLKKALCWRDLP